MTIRTALLFILVIPFTVLAGAGCVTVKIADNDVRRAEGVKFNEPSAPFTKEDRDEVDAAWKNSANGNVISYLSDCNDPTDPPLTQITAGVVGGLSELNILDEKSVTVQGREGRRVHASGKVDGVPTEIDILAFKRNHCIFVLSYVGVKAAFAANRPAFNKFIEGFRAP